MQMKERPLPGLQLYLNNISFQNFTRKGPGLVLGNFAAERVLSTKWLYLINLCNLFFIFIKEQDTNTVVNLQQISTR